VSWGEKVSADWEAIYRSCAPSLRRFIRSRVPEALVEDALQDTFVRAYRSRARFDTARPPLPWLLTIARRACAETLKQLPPDAPGIVVDLPTTCVDDEPHPHFENRQRVEQMHRALAGLSSRHRRLLLAWDVEGESPYPVLAAQEGISTKALKSALCRARTAFRSRYSVLAERSGVAAVVGWVPARLRARMQRAWTWWVHGSPIAEATLGGIAVVIASVAVVLVPTPVPTGAARLTMAGTSASAIDPLPTSPSKPAEAHGVVNDRPPSAVRVPTASGGGRVGEPPATIGSGAIAADGGADIGVGPDTSDASFRLGIHDPGGAVTLNEEVEIRCDGAVRRIVCDFGRETPLGH
jgi:RNA polymerase sigma-70 factor (ECF subfamily)